MLISPHRAAKIKKYKKIVNNRLDISAKYEWNFSTGIVCRKSNIYDAYL